MSNAIVVTMTGKDNLSKVADDTQKNVSGSMRKMSDNAAASAADLEKRLDRLADSVDETSKEIGDIARKSSGKGRGFEGVRDSADDTERRIVGFRDSLTGTGDVMKGLRDGDMVTLATGFADLASSVANLGADMLDWGKKAFQASRDVVKAHAASVLAKGKDIAATVAHKAASLASTIATQAQAAAQWALNAAMSANPIVLVVAALAALVAIFVIAWKNSETFREIVTGAFDAVKAAAEAVWHWISDNWPLLLAILTGPIGLAVLAIVENWDKIKAGFTAVKDWIAEKITDIVGFFTGLPGRIAGAFGDGFSALKDKAFDAKTWVVERFDEVVEFFKGIPGKVADAFKDLAETIIKPFRAAFDWVEGVYDRTIAPIINAIKSLDPTKFGGGIDVSKVVADMRAAGKSDEEIKRVLGNNVGPIGSFAFGGRVPGPLGAPMLAVVHGGEEVRTAAQQGGGGTTVIFELNGRELARALITEGNRSGGLPIRIRAAS